MNHFMNNGIEYLKDEQTLVEIYKLFEAYLKSYNDYPESAVNNAKKVLKWREEHGKEVKGMTNRVDTRFTISTKRQIDKINNFKNGFIQKTSKECGN